MRSSTRDGRTGSILRLVHHGYLSVNESNGVLNIAELWRGVVWSGKKEPLDVKLLKSLDGDPDLPGFYERDNAAEVVRCIL